MPPTAQISEMIRPAGELALPRVIHFPEKIAVTGSVNRFHFQERLDYIRAYGNHCMSFSTLQPGMQYFDVPGKGFIAFMPKWGSAMVLSDPVCADGDRERLIGDFLKIHPRTGFIQITEPVADLMHHQFGYYATQFGIETIIDLNTWSISGKKKQVLRTALNQAKKMGVEIRECPGENCYHELSKNWMSTRKIKNREIGFLIRPMNMDHQHETRKFFAYLDGEIIGFIFFDPVYQDGKIISYVPNISRFSHEFRQGIFYAIMLTAMDQFKQEGLGEINLGLSILVLDEADKKSEALLLKNIERLIFRYGNFIYNFKGISFTKSRFMGRENKFYCAHKWFLPAVKLISVFKLANVF